MSIGLNNYDFSTILLCQPYLNGKQQRILFSNNTTFCATKLLELIHYNLYRPINQLS